MSVRRYRMGRESHRRPRPAQISPTQSPRFEAVPCLRRAKQTLSPSRGLHSPRSFGPRPVLAPNSPWETPVRRRAPWHRIRAARRLTVATPRDSSVGMEARARRPSSPRAPPETRSPDGARPTAFHDDSYSTCVFERPRRGTTESPPEGLPQLERRHPQSAVAVERAGTTLRVHAGGRAAGAGSMPCPCLCSCWPRLSGPCGPKRPMFSRSLAKVVRLPANCLL
jgi:hypothetical protein